MKSVFIIGAAALIAGGVAGTVVGTRDQRAVIDDCLIQHGYKLTASGT